MSSTKPRAEDLEALAAASLALTSELSLDTVLQKVVDVARGHVDCKYAALSVVNPGGEIQRFFTSGITDEERAAIGPLPRGRGLLGVLIHEGQTLRLDDMSKDPRSVPFPPNHPAMRSLLGLPLTFGSRIIGNLYLTEKNGASGFTDRDEAIVRLFAGQAAVAIRNAELFEAETRRAQEWKALFELGREVTASPDLQQLLDSVVTRARQLLGTDLAALMLLTSDGAALQTAAESGMVSAKVKEVRLLSDMAAQSLALQSRRPIVVVDYAHDDRLRGQKSSLAVTEDLVSLITVPLLGKERVLGSLLVGNRRPTEFTERQAELLEAFANWTAVAMETSNLYQRVESLARLEERERIGMDLHDGVIQSIYAVGLHLEDCLERLDEAPETVAEGLGRAMDSLNQVIKDIRSYIFDLRPQVSQVADLPEAIRQLVEDVRVNTLMKARVEIEGKLTGRINQDQALSLFHIAQEALNNVSKHSQATEVSLWLAADRQSVTLEVRDNGVGMDEDVAVEHEHHGLRNIRDRARTLGASLAIETAPGKGTSVKVELPLSADEV